MKDEFNFQKVSNFTHFQSINQTIHQVYLFIITFQNLEFWDVTLAWGLDAATG